MKVSLEIASQIPKIKHYYGFRHMVNPDAYNRIFDKLNLESYYSPQTTVVDLFSGPGLQSVVLNERLKPANHLLLETHNDFAKFMAEDVVPKCPSLQYLKQDPYEWKTYTDLAASGQLQPVTQPRDKINNQFLILANLTGLIGEGLFMQWLACIGNKNWLHKYGRVKMLVWMSDATAIKILAKPGDLARSKASVVTEAFTNSKLVAVSDQVDMSKFNKVIVENNPVLLKKNDFRLESSKGTCLVEVDPINHDIDIDNWDYVTKHLLILKSTKLETALDSLGHGGKEYFAQVTDKELLKKMPKDLTKEEFIELTRLFYLWPFKPDIYMDFIDVFSDDGH